MALAILRLGCTRDNRSSSRFARRHQMPEIHDDGKLVGVRDRPTLHILKSGRVSRSKYRYLCPEVATEVLAGHAVDPHEVLLCSGVAVAVTSVSPVVR